MQDIIVGVKIDNSGAITGVKNIDKELGKIGKNVPKTDPLKSLNTGLKETAKNTKEANTETDKYGKSLGMLKKMAVGFLSIQFAKKIAAGTYELAQLGAKADLVTKNFQVFANQAGMSAESMMTSLRSATLGMMDDMTLQQNAMKAMISGVSFDDMIVAMEYVGKYAIATGADVNTKMQTVMTGFARGSAQFLDDVGIQVMGASDVVGAAVDQMKEKMGSFNVSAGDATVGVEQMRADLSQMAVEIGTTLIPVLESVTEIMRFWSPIISKTITDLMEVNKVLFTSYTLDDLRFKRQVELYEKQKDTNALFTERQKVLSKEEQLFARIATLQKQITSGRDTGDGIIEGLSPNEIKIVQGTIDKLTKELIKAQSQSDMLKSSLNRLTQPTGGGKTKTGGNVSGTKTTKTTNTIDNTIGFSGEDAYLMAMISMQDSAQASWEKHQAEKVAAGISAFKILEENDIASARYIFEEKKRIKEEEEALELEAIERRQERNELILSSAMSVGTQMLSIANTFQSMNSNNEKKAMSDWQKREQDKIKTLNVTNKRREQLQDQLDKEMNAKKKEQFEKDKKWAIATAIINGALGLTSALTTKPTVLGIILGALVTASTIASVAKISSQSFAEGGIVRNTRGAGVDREPAMLTAGEIVSNSRQQENLIRAMETGQNPYVNNNTTNSSNSNQVVNFNVVNNVGGEISAQSLANLQEANDVSLDNLENRLEELKVYGRLSI